MQGVLAVDIVTAAIAIGLMIFVRVPEPKNKPQVGMVSPKMLIADVREAIRYVVTWPGLLMMIMMASLINMALSPGSNLTPLHVINFFGKGAQELAWLQVAMGIGGIAGGLLLGVWGGFKRRVWTILMGILGIGAGMLLFGLVPANHFSWSLVAFGIVGLMSSFTNGASLPLLLTKVPSEKHGRVLTLLGSLSLGMMPIGLFLAAPIADRFGTQITYVIGGAFCLIIGIVGMVDRRVNTLDLQKEGGVLTDDDLTAD